MVFGLDMTEEMLVVANRNIEQSGLKNIKLLKGDIEHMPLTDNAVDVIISNCVINLSPDKARVLREAFRVLKPGGRFAVFDIVLEQPLPQRLQGDTALWSACISGALLKEEYLRLLGAAGFKEASIEVQNYSCGD
jgi:ubiquinone/menaquinone biosynthesis C-methylase UbiE